jgi:hypothetical protein
MSFGTLSCHLLLLTQFLAIAHQDLLGFLSFLSFGFESSFLAFPKMSEDKKAIAETKLSLSEEKNLGFLESISKTNTEKITREILKVYLKILVIVTVMMWKVAGKTPKIDPGGQAMQFFENQPLNKAILSI